MFSEPAAAADLPQWVLNYARDNAMFIPGDRVLTAVSGGPDSVALLHLLAGLQESLGVILGVAHFDHGLRGEESQADAAFVEELARRLSLPCHLGQGRVRDLARQEKLSLQMAGRQLRFDFFQQLCRTHHYHKVALGHTADDQVELFWVRLLRGASPQGLKGMWPATPGGLVRPLLSVAKEVLLAWLRQQGLAYRTDSSNLSRVYLRNRVRLDLLPELSRHYNPRLPQAVWRLQSLLQGEERFLSRETDRALDLTVRRLAEDFFSLNLPVFFTLDPALQNRVLQAVAGKAGGDLPLTASQVASLLDLGQGRRSGGLLSLGRQVKVARAGQELHFFKALPPPPGDKSTMLAAGSGETEGPEGWRWQLSQVPYGPQTRLPPPPHVAFLDLDRLMFPLEVRHFRTGDRFWPQGAPGAKKLQDFLVDRKIPRWLRPYLPLVESGGKIVWVAGLRVAEPVKIGPHTRTVLQIELSATTPAARRLWDLLQACGTRAKP